MVADVAPESIPGNLSEENEDLMGCLFGALGVQLSGISDDLLRSHPQLARWATSAPKGRIGTAIGLALGLGLIAAKERGLPFAADLEGWMFGGPERAPEQPQNRTSVGPSAVASPAASAGPVSLRVAPAAPCEAGGTGTGCIAPGRYVLRVYAKATTGNEPAVSREVEFRIK